MYIDYQRLLDDSMLDFMKKVLIQLQQDNNLCTEFYISFRTCDTGVVLSERVKKKFPEDITIVLEPPFEDLAIFHDKFSITLSFQGIKENVVIPFKALIGFSDPAVNFSLQFQSYAHADEALEMHYSEEYFKNHGKKTGDANSLDNQKKDKSSADIVQFDKFRRKTDKNNK